MERFDQRIPPKAPQKHLKKFNKADFNQLLREIKAIETYLSALENDITRRYGPGKHASYYAYDVWEARVALENLSKSIQRHFGEWLRENEPYRSRFDNEYPSIVAKEPASVTGVRGIEDRIRQYFPLHEVEEEMPNCKDCQPPLTKAGMAYCEYCKETYGRVEQDKRIKEQGLGEA